MEVRFAWQAQGVVRLQGGMEVTFRFLVRVRRVDAERFVRLCVVVEVNVAVTSGCYLEGLCVLSDGCFRVNFGGRFVQNARFADFDV